MRKPDRYETRARELALAAGVDPDSRMERPGQRSMPAWCAYRDVARKEHLAAEAVEAELSIATNSPQAPRYVSYSVMLRWSAARSGCGPGFEP
jgi:tRNA-splicing ligase RtcB